VVPSLADGWSHTPGGTHLKVVPCCWRATLVPVRSRIRNSLSADSYSELSGELVSRVTGRSSAGSFPFFEHPPTRSRDTASSLQLHTRLNLGPHGRRTRTARPMRDGRDAQAIGCQHLRPVGARGARFNSVGRLGPLRPKNCLRIATYEILASGMNSNSYRFSHRGGGLAAGVVSVRGPRTSYLATWAVEHSPLRGGFWPPRRGAFHPDKPRCGHRRGCWTSDCGGQRSGLCATLGSGTSVSHRLLPP
jgi:hypothetical protein